MEYIDWANLTVGVAAVMAVVFAVRAYVKLTHEFMAFLSNHMSATVKAEGETVRALDRVADRLGRIEHSMSDHRVEVKSEGASEVTVEGPTREGV